MTAPVVLLFRRDLRLDDNPALDAALASGKPVIPLYIDAGQADAARPLGKAGRWWLVHSLAALHDALLRLESYLVVRSGAPEDVLPAFAREVGAAEVYWEPGREPHERECKRRIEWALHEQGIDTHAGRGNVLFPPHRIRTKTGTRFRVFTPFWRACKLGPSPDEPLSYPMRISSPHPAPLSETMSGVSDARFGERLDRQFGTVWNPGEAGALARLDSFTTRAMAGYAAGRDALEKDATTRLSPHLAFGEISARRIWHTVEECRVRANAEPGSKVSLDANVETLQRQLAWRDFAAHLLVMEPQMATRPLRDEFCDFPWEPEEYALQAWQDGRTGYPLVDAGMRELRETGYMHNRVRMIAASFLVKDLLIPWQAGEAFFWEHLVDADLANNAMNWQWVAGCGADAAPFFRIFNPTLQAEKFDPTGAYIRKWVPERRDLPDVSLRQPDGVQDYPSPIVDHREARERALEALATIKK